MSVTKGEGRKLMLGQYLQCKDLSESRNGLGYVIESVSACEHGCV